MTQSPLRRLFVESDFKYPFRRGGQAVLALVANAPIPTSVATALAAKAGLVTVDPVVVTASGALVINTVKRVDATAGVPVMTLPSTATAGDQVTVEKVDSSANAVQVTGKIRSATATESLVGQFEVRTYRWVNASVGWEPGPGHKTKSWLDATYAAIARAVPTGGTTGQVLAKNSGTDGDWSWSTLASAVSSVNGYTGAVTLTKADVGLNNANNTADSTKPVSTAQQAALDTKPTLDGNGKIPTSYIPAAAIFEVFSVASQAAMLALTAQSGDVAIRTDFTPARRYQLLGTGDPTTLANWQLVSVDPNANVDSVNGQTGAVTLGASNVGALATGNNLSDVPSPTTARNNLGLGSAATQASNAFDPAGAATAAAVGRKLVLTQTAVKTGAYTASPGDLVLYDISSASGTLTLPATTSKWEVVVKVHVAAAIPTSGVPPTTLTVALNSSTDTLNGTTNGTLTMRYQGRSKTFACDGAGNVTVSSGDTDATVEQTINDNRYLATLPSACIYSGVDQAISNQSLTSINLPSVDYNRDANNISTTSGTAGATGNQIKVLTAGLYLIEYSVYYTNGTNAFVSHNVQIRLNGNAAGNGITDVGNSGGASQRMGFSTTRALAANDIISLGCYFYEAATLAGSTNNAKTNIRLVVTRLGN